MVWVCWVEKKKVGFIGWLVSERERERDRDGDGDQERGRIKTEYFK